MNPNRGQFVFDLESLNASAQAGNLPEKIMLLPYGEFNTVKGKIVFDKARAERAVANFKAGVGRVHGTAPIPINFNHKQSGKAGGWIHELSAEDDGLYSSKTSWSKSGKEALEGEEYRFCSIEYWFRNFSNSHDATRKYEDVVQGAALTNIPLFDNMKPVMAEKSSSGLTDGSKPNIVYLEDRSNDVSVTLEAARAMKPTEVAANEEARTVLLANKDQLNFAERAAFGLDDKKAPEKVVANNDNKTEPEKVVAEKDAVIDQLKAEAKERDERLAKLEAESAEKDAEKIVDEHVARGAIKAEAKNDWVKLLAESKGDAHTALAKQLSELPTNELLANNRKGQKVDTSSASLQEELKTETLKIQAEAKKEGRDLSYAQAQDEVLRANKDLEDRINAERESR